MLAALSSGRSFSCDILRFGFFSLKALAVLKFRIISIALVTNLWAPHVDDYCSCYGDVL